MLYLRHIYVAKAKCNCFHKSDRYSIKEKAESDQVWSAPVLPKVLGHSIQVFQPLQWYMKIKHLGMQTAFYVCNLSMVLWQFATWAICLFMKIPHSNSNVWWSIVSGNKVVTIITKWKQLETSETQQLSGEVSACWDTQHAKIANFLQTP